MIIAIAGGSGSGKSTLCQALIEHLGADAVTHIAQDHYYRQQDGDQGDGNLNYDHPDAIEFELLCEQLIQLKQGHSVQMPVYDFALHNRKDNRIQVDPKPFIVVEGILVLTQQSLRQAVDLCVFVTAPEPLRFERRAERDQRERGRTLESVRAQFCNTVAPMHNQYVEPSKRYADLVVSGEDRLPVALRQVTSEMAKPKVQSTKTT